MIVTQGYGNGLLVTHGYGGPGHLMAAHNWCNPLINSLQNVGLILSLQVSGKTDSLQDVGQVLPLQTIGKIDNLKDKGKIKCQP